MSAELLREAAAKMRERAEAAPAGAWGSDEIDAVWVDHDPDGASSSVLVERFPIWADGAGAHIASWHPAVALAVADWLDSEDTHQFGPTEHAINVARAYLGRDA